MRKIVRLSTMLLILGWFSVILPGCSAWAEEEAAELLPGEMEDGQTDMLPFLTVGKSETEDVPFKVACIGDSITYGDGVAASIETEAYPAILQGILGEAYEVRNFGLSGSTLIKEGDFAYTESEQYNQAVEYEADLYIIMLGTNDSKPHNWSADLYREELEHVIGRFKALASKPKILLMVPPKYFGIVRVDQDGSRIRNEIILYKIKPILEETAEQEKLDLLDLYELTGEHPDWFDDGLHPNADGNRAIAEAIYAEMFQN